MNKKLQAELANEKETYIYVCSECGHEREKTAVLSVRMPRMEKEYCPGPKCETERTFYLRKP